MNEYLANIFQQLRKGLPVDWNELILQVIYDEDAYDIKYYARIDEHTFVDCFSMGIDEEELNEILINTEAEVSKLREYMKEENGNFMTMTLTVDYDGNTKTDFGYDDVNDDIVKYCDDWEKKYLK